MQIAPNLVSDRATRRSHPSNFLDRSSIEHIVDRSIGIFPFPEVINPTKIAVLLLLLLQDGSEQFQKRPS